MASKAERRAQRIESLERLIGRELPPKIKAWARDLGKAAVADIGFIFAKEPRATPLEVLRGLGKRREAKRRSIEWRQRQKDLDPSKPDPERLSSGNVIRSAKAGMEQRQDRYGPDESIFAP